MGIDSGFSCFCLWWKTIWLVLLAFRDNLFTASQLLILPSSSLMFSVVLFGAFVDLNFEMLLMIVVSSSYKLNLKASVALCMSFI